MSRFFGQVFAAASMGFWVAVMGYVSWWMVHYGRVLAHYDWVWTGLALVLMGVLVFAVSVRGAWLVLMVLLGMTTSRLARRDFRNSVADMLMFAKTGLWRE